MGSGTPQSDTSAGGVLHPPRAVLFDLGNVLCTFDWHASAERLAARLDGIPASQIVAWLLGPTGPHDPYCRGEIDDRRLLEALHARLDPGRTLDDSWLRALWCDMFTPLPEMLALVDRLRGQTHLGLVSNTNSMHFEQLDRQLRLRERFDALTLSYRVGALKPDRRMFDSALAQAGVPSGEAFFVDDVPEFVVAARGLGLRAHVFDGAHPLRARLRQLGLALD